MRIQVTQPLFAWDELEDSPTLKTIKQLLEVIPDGDLLDGLQAARGRGRDDVPVRVAWGVLVLSVALRHPSIEACLGELRRNESLRKLIGIESEEAVPQATKKFERLYKGRTAVERVIGRLKFSGGPTTGT